MTNCQEVFLSCATKLMFNDVHVIILKHGGVAIIIHDMLSKSDVKLMLFSFKGRKWFDVTQICQEIEGTGFPLGCILWARSSQVVMKCSIRNVFLGKLLTCWANGWLGVFGGLCLCLFVYSYFVLCKLMPLL